MGAAARYALVRLPAVRGSRQSFNVKLATAILNNVSACLKYDDQVRVDGYQNQAPHCSIMPLTIPRIKLGVIFTHATTCNFFCVCAFSDK
jgi:hypothetical protein